MQRLDGQVALVTGASRGVGKGIALELASAGATVYITGRRVEDMRYISGKGNASDVKPCANGHPKSFGNGASAPHKPSDGVPRARWT